MNLRIKYKQNYNLSFSILYVTIIDGLKGIK